MVTRGRSGPAAGVAICVVVLTSAALWCGAVRAGAVSDSGKQVTATGTADPSTVRITGNLVSTVEENTVTLVFPASGGPVTGELRLVFRNEFTDFLCVTRSTFTNSLNGTYDDDARSFGGRTTASGGRQVVSGCGDATFARTTQESTWSATIDLSTGEIKGSIAPSVQGGATLTFVATAPVGALTPPTTESTRSTEETPGTDTDTGARAGDGGFPIVIVIIVLVIVGIGLIVFFAVRRAGAVGGTYPDWDTTYPDWQTPPPGGVAAARAGPAKKRRLTAKKVPARKRAAKKRAAKKRATVFPPVAPAETPVETPVDPCAELRAGAERARKACDDARAAADRAETAAREAAADRAAVDPGTDPGREASITDPVTGETITQTDLRLREAALGDLWRDYRANPSPEKAREVEDAWNRANTPEFREETRRRAQDARDAEQEARARADEARRTADDLCARATEAERRLQECLDAHAPPAPTREPRSETLGAAPPTPTLTVTLTPPAEPAPAPTPRDEPTPAPAPTPTGGPAPTGACRDGDTRWDVFDGPQPFEVWVDGENPSVTVRVVVLGRELRTAGLVQSEITDARGGTTHERLASVSRDTWHHALADVETALFDATASGRESQRDARYDDVAATIVVRVPRAAFNATCSRLLECVGGVWVDTGRRRCDVQAARSPGPLEQTIQLRHTTWDDRRTEDRQRTTDARTKFWTEVDRAFGAAVAEARQRVDQRDLLNQFRARCEARGR